MAGGKKVFVEPHRHAGNVFLLVLSFFNPLPHNAAF